MSKPDTAFGLGFTRTGSAGLAASHLLAPPGWIGSRVVGSAEPVVA
jgi:hypothetical protein